MKKIYHGFIYIFVMCLFFISFPVAFIIYGRKKYWIVSEVDFDARDNGIHFFKYVKENHPELNIVFLISKKNPNYSLVCKIGNTVEPHSYKHMLIFIASKAKISTAVHGCSPSWCITNYLLKHHGTGKNIALKHGIFKNLHPNYFKKNAHLDLICCGGKPEFEFINKEFGYDEGVAKYTGLARFDGLHDATTKKEIFIMPTWRRWLDGIKDKNDFENSDYYKNWASLLGDKRFLNLIKTSGLEVCFYVHPKLNKFLESFDTLKGHVKFLNSKSGDSVQQHLKEAAIMITDFSSVFFDFAYMRKPAIYFQFDEEQYYKSHYIKAYFDYRYNGFGPVATIEEEVISSLEDIINNGLKMPANYLSRAEAFFPLFDNKNCERIYNAICEVVKK